MAQTTGFDPENKVKVSFDCKMFGVGKKGQKLKHMLLKLKMPVFISSTIPTR